MNEERGRRVKAGIGRELMMEDGREGATDRRVWAGDGADIREYRGQRERLGESSI